MKRFYLLLLICIAVVSCKKSTDETTASTARFTITGVHDVDLSFSSDGSVTIPIAVVPNSASRPDTVTLSAGNLPRGVSAVFTPDNGITPFNSHVTFRYDYTGTGGTYPITVTGTGKSGVRSYNLNLVLAPYRGWEFGGILYTKTGLIKDAGDGKRYPTIKVFGGGAGELTISFSIGKKLPTVNKTYKITSSDNNDSNEIRIAMYDDPILFGATGVNLPTGTFTFDTLGKFTFKCTNVEMSNGLEKKMLNCWFSE